MVAVSPPRSTQAPEVPSRETRELAPVIYSAPPLAVQARGVGENGVTLGG